MTSGGHSGLPLEQTITIINNSGKIISTGKQLLSIWKTAQISYKEKRTELKQERATERAAERKIQRSQTFDPTRSITYQQSRQLHQEDDRKSRRAYDEQSVASSRRSHKSSRSNKDAAASRPQHALTENNLKTLSEVSSTAPSIPPPNYRSPYAETLPGNGALSRLHVGKSDLMSLTPSEYTQPPPMPGRTQSDSVIEARKKKSERDIDMDLAYGNIPPDLKDRTDLDPKLGEEEAEDLIQKVENLLDEAHCAQHSATAMIKHLQERPDAAAAVALALAELSSLVAKLSPSFMVFLKGGSPAVFALLSSPQFLIGTGIAVGVTVVMFGGWRIVKKVAENELGKRGMTFDGMGQPEHQPDEVDEAIVLNDMEEELSSIETWRRGIVTDWEVESADMELMTPLADRATREWLGKDVSDDSDARSQRSSKTHKSSKSHASHKTHKTHQSKHDKDSSDKKSRKGDDDAASVASSRMSKKTSSSRKTDLKAIDDGKSVKLEALPFKAKQNMLRNLFKKKAQSQAVRV